MLARLLGRRLKPRLQLATCATGLLLGGGQRGLGVCVLRRHLLAELLQLALGVLGAQRKRDILGEQVGKHSSALLFLLLGAVVLCPHPALKSHMQLSGGRIQGSGGRI